MSGAVSADHAFLPRKLRVAVEHADVIVLVERHAEVFVELHSIFAVAPTFADLDGRLAQQLLLRALEGRWSPDAAAVRAGARRTWAPRGPVPTPSQTGETVL